MTIRAISGGHNYAAEYLAIGPGDYCSESERIAGKWMGRGAELLGLQSEVDMNSLGSSGNAISIHKRPAIYRPGRLRHSRGRSRLKQWPLAMGKTSTNGFLLRPGRDLTTAVLVYEQAIIAAIHLGERRCARLGKKDKSGIRSPCLESNMAGSGTERTGPKAGTLGRTWRLKKGGFCMW